MKIVVYGTLKAGGKLHHIMNDIGAKFIEATTLDGFDMYNLGWYPAIVESLYGKIYIEIYEINDDKIEMLDTVEGYPYL